MKLVCGLGNPGKEYANTPHNAGFMVVDHLANAWNISFQSKFNALLGSGLVGGVKSELVKPLTFMNCSGAAVQQVASYFKISPEDIIVVHDDIDLEFGQIKLKKGGGEGGHNGLRSITSALKTKEYLRVRVGIGRPKDSLGSKTAASHVLKGLSGNSLQELKTLAEQASNAVEHLLKEGLSATQMRFHGVN
ncbi:MAG: aminoacyl-tRNA hydrolase [Candidatus Ancillula sp.]|nr:aminoacyl-tRNA hydrolase [Candidatus Ancillula sp.]